MSRNPLIEAIHEARYDLQTCAEKDKPGARAKLYTLLHEAASRANPPVRPDDVLDAVLWSVVLISALNFLLSAFPGRFA